MRVGLKQPEAIPSASRWNAAWLFGPLGGCSTSVGIQGSTHEGGEASVEGGPARCSADPRRGPGDGILGKMGLRRNGK
jgi:hypothetical protein